MRKASVEPSGRVISPAGEMDGGPGGSFYRGECRDTGIYQIQVGQRGPKRAGSYDLTIEITPREMEMAKGRAGRISCLMNASKSMSGLVWLQSKPSPP